MRILMGAGALVLGFNSVANTLWGQLFAKVDTLAAGTFGAADFSPCGLLNYVFPLDTLCTLISAYAAVVLVCAAIRIIKSFIPSIA